MTDMELKAEIERLLGAIGVKFEFVRLVQAHNVDTDASKVRLEMTFELR